MRRSNLVSVTLFVLALCSPAFLAAEDQSRLSSIPRVDVHAHVGGDPQVMDAYLQISDVLKEQYNTNLDIWIDLGSYRRPKKLTESDFADVEKKYAGRFLQSLSDYRIADGLQYTPEEIERWQDRGAGGYKIWIGVSSLSDSPANEATYCKMEQLGFLGASIHVSQPYPTKWCRDVVKFWEAQNAWERVLDRHPKLIVVMAHMLNYNMSGEQLDYLQYVMETYPNVNLDLAARIGWFCFLDRDAIRDFLIKYSDRILFGTDIADQVLKEDPAVTARRYHRCFRILETDETIDAGFFPAPGEGRREVKGMALPVDVLEKIYYKNAARLYPQVKDVLQRRGYTIEVERTEKTAATSAPPIFD